MTTKIYENLSQDELIQESLLRSEGEIAENGSLSVKTGNRTGRSPQDRFIVNDNLTESTVDWGEINKPFDQKNFVTLWERVETYLSKKDVFVSNLHVGEHSTHYIPIQIKTQWAWHNLFGNQMFIKPRNFNPSNNDSQPAVINISPFEL